MKAIIGGTGIYSTAGEKREKIVETKYGKVVLDMVNIEGEEIVFLARHGKEHSTPPHLINYRANIQALKDIGVNYIYTTGAVGSCDKAYAPGDVVIINDFVDFTSHRPVTFFDGGKEAVKHVDMSDPYCKNMRAAFIDKARQMGLDVKGEAVYACTEGPRFETASEVRMFKNLGGQVVGMTSSTEAILAKELGMCFSTIGIISNWCTGMTDEIALHDIESAVGKNRELISQVCLAVFKDGLDKVNCNCDDALIEL